MLLKLADSLMPTTSSVVTTNTISTAGRLKMAVTCPSVVGSVPAPLMASSNPELSATQPALVFSTAANAAGISINSVPRAAESAGGTMMPKSWRKETT